MKNCITLLVLICALSTTSQPLDSLLPVRGFCIAAPKPNDLDRFVKFINEELAPGQFNTLVLRVDYNYQYTSHPELQDENALSAKDVSKLVESAKKNGIRLIPQINLLGHQSWAGKLEKLLEVYPQFDETPHVTMPEKYVWPNEDGLYCKSYCPLHPEVHGVVFDLIDELLEAFQATAFHAGLDEVFYLADKKCPRCSGKAESELFAFEVTTIRDHLAKSNRQLWMWGDRLIDGRESGLGMWEASENGTHSAIDLIPKDVMICDWHYEKAEPVPPYFAMNGLDVISCPWNKGQVGIDQIDQMLLYRKTANSLMANRFKGVMQTIWQPAGEFLDGYYSSDIANQEGDIKSFKMMASYLNTLNLPR